MTKIGEIVRRLLSCTEGATQEQARELQQILTPDPRATLLDAQNLASILRAGREEALAAILAKLPLERIAAQLGGSEEARAHAVAVLNAPFPPRTPQSLEFIDAQTARIQALEDCVRLLTLALVEVLHPSPRESPTAFHTTASRRQ
jgi:hypothetical protein